MKPRKSNLIQLMGSLWFGGILLVVAAIYVALGAFGASLGGWFDRTDSEYLNRWPLKTLFVLVLLNLILFTWQKVPLTRRWFGVWCINGGALILIAALNLHLSRSVVGSVRMYLDGSLGPMAVDRFYDVDQRSLFIRVGQEAPVEISLENLPRYGSYDAGHSGIFSARGLVGIEPGVESADASSGGTRIENLAELVGCTGQKLKVDVVGFYPTAKLATEFLSDPNSSTTGVKLTELTGVRWLAGSDRRFRVDDGFEGVEFQHLDVDATSAAGVIEAAGKLNSPGDTDNAGPHVHDPFQLRPVQKKIRHTFLTPPGGKELVDITAGTDSEPVKVQQNADGVEDLVLPGAKLHVERQDQIRLVDNVVKLSADQAGKERESTQVISLKLSIGTWSGLLNVPFAVDAAEHLSQDQWRGGVVRLPGAIAPLQFQLGNSTRPLPASLELLKESGLSDPEFTFSVADPITGAASIDSVKLNQPIYYANGKWVLFPIAYQPAEKWVQVRVQSRPALWLMIAGATLVLIGLVYSFISLLIARKRRREV